MNPTQSSTAALDTDHHTDQRTRLVQGLRDIADFLDQHPDIPADHPSLVLLHLADRQEVDRIAAMLGVRSTENTRSTHYRAGISFGPIRYEALSIARTEMAARTALQTDSTNVTP
jgi:hypothetical protein